jgi:hypothetical protein
MFLLKAAIDSPHMPWARFSQGQRPSPGASPLGCAGPLTPATGISPAAPPPTPTEWSQSRQQLLMHGNEHCGGKPSAVKASPVRPQMTPRRRSLRAARTRLLHWPRSREDSSPTGLWKSCRLLVQNAFDGSRRMATSLKPVGAFWGSISTPPGLRQRRAGAVHRQDRIRSAERRYAEVRTTD